MKEDNENNNEVSTCPKIELGTHQNSYNPKNTEIRDDKK